MNGDRNRRRLSGIATRIRERCGCGANLFNFTLLLATMTTLVPYVFTSLAALILIQRDSVRFGGMRPALNVVIAVLAFLYSLWTLYGAGAEVVMWGTLLLFAGLPVDVWMKRQNALPAE